MPAQDGTPGDVSPSVRAALEWAGAAALLRSGDGHPLVDTFDLLAGVALAHPGESRPEQLLRHFGLPLGSVLAARYPDPFDAVELGAARARARATPPGLGADVQDVFAAARSLASPQRPSSGSREGIHLGDVLGALLELGPAATAIADALRGQGVDASRVRAAYRDFSVRGEDAGDLPAYLTTALPWGGPPGEVLLPDYLADEPGPGRVAAGAAEPRDLVGIGPQVDAFAYLATSTVLEPPLAVGLFGDWGSGKSFFMRALQRRIDALTNHPDAQGRPAPALPFFRRVAQVEFNAWHYVDGDLWASLVEHLFQNLRVRADEGPVELAERREQVMGLIRDASNEAGAAERAVSVLEQRMKTATANVAKAQEARDALREAMPAAVGAIALAQVQQQVDRALRAAGVDRAVTSVEEAREGLDEARDALRRGGRVLAPFRRGMGWVWLALAVVAVVAVPVAVAAVLDRFADQIAAAVGGVASVVGVVAMLARTAAAVTNRAVTGVERARDELENQVTGRERDVDDATAALREAERGLRAAIAERDRLAARRDELERQASALAGTVLGEFIEASAANDELRAHLGVPAIVRRRLEALSDLIAANNREVLAGRGDPEQVNRIILYVDDLDRCPADHVIRVLQAVHLLLAFPLFVVVVAVDKRWLAGALAGHYGPLLAGGRNGDRATPDDYVEKIFQVPFQVPPLAADARRSLVRGLLPVGDGQRPAAGPAPRLSGPPDARVEELIAGFFRRPGPPVWLRRAELRVTAAELEFAERVIELLDDTPRSVKRFANVFLLVKWIAANSGEPFRDEVPDDHRSVILLLALGMGHPEAARRVHDAIAAGDGRTLGEIVGRRDPALLGPVTDWAGRPVTALARWADLCRRFTFTT